jgi:hypothetical protein
MPKKQLEETISNDVPCVYKSIPKQFLTSYHNPSKKHHNLEIPFRMLIVGASGSGKTQLIVHILNKMKDTFGNIKIFTRNKSEPIYEWMEKKIPSTHLQIYENLSDLPSLQKDKDGNVKGYEKDIQHLVVFDDLCLEKDQSKLAEYFIRSRKIAKGVSLMYLTQSYFKVPKTIRINLNYVILKKLSSTRDLNLIMSDYNLGITKEKLMQIYKYCTNKKTDFLLLDLDNEVENRYRHNLLEVIDTNKEIPKIATDSNKEDQKEEEKAVEVEGDGLLDPFINKDLSNTVKSYLRAFGSIPITSMKLVKNDVSNLIVKPLNTLSGQNYDKLFHLGILVEINRRWLILEKNATINLTGRFSLKNRVQIPVNIPVDLTLNKIFEKTRARMGDSFVRYSANQNNCQDFVLAVLESNGLMTPQLFDFVKQDTEAIFKNKPIIRKVVNTVTDLGAVVDNAVDNAGTILGFNAINGSGVKVHKVYYTDV